VEIACVQNEAVLETCLERSSSLILASKAGAHSGCCCNIFDNTMPLADMFQKHQAAGRAPSKGRSEGRQLSTRGSPRLELNRRPAPRDSQNDVRIETPWRWWPGWGHNSHSNNPKSTAAPKP